MNYEVISHKAITIDLDDLEGRQPYCLACSKPIQNKTVVIEEVFRYDDRVMTSYWNVLCYVTTDD
jgi:hypothetical protein